MTAEQIRFDWPAVREHALPPNEQSLLAPNSFGGDCVAASRTDILRSTPVKVR